MENVNVGIANSRGTVYFLHTKEVRLRPSLPIRSIYFFSKSEEGAIPVPNGYQVIENSRSGLLFLKKA